MNLGIRNLQYDNFINNIYYPEKTSIIAKNIFGVKEMNIYCQICQTVNYEFDIFKFIEFPIEEIYYKKQENKFEEKK